mmetsp:Transcript_81155/g.181550  ORF Transcript_81155/g.181550 Transcript_81155/m.181550 type:complete len:132 (-) Transcript_81155:124-519(-)
MQQRTLPSGARRRVPAFLTILVGLWLDPAFVAVSRTVKAPRTRPLSRPSSPLSPQWRPSAVQRHALAPDDVIQKVWKKRLETDAARPDLRGREWAADVPGGVQVLLIVVLSGVALYFLPVGLTALLQSLRG